MSHIKSRIHTIDVFLIQFFSEQLHSLPKALEVNDLPLTQEFDHIINIGIVRKPENVVIGDPSFLFWCDHR